MKKTEETAQQKISIGKSASNSHSANLGKRTPVDMIPKMLEELEINSDLDLLETPVKKIKHRLPKSLLP